MYPCKLVLLLLTEYVIKFLYYIHMFVIKVSVITTNCIVKKVVKKKKILTVPIPSYALATCPKKTGNVAH